MILDYVIDVLKSSHGEVGIAVMPAPARN
jgi:hypothetical protein